MAVTLKVARGAARKAWRCNAPKRPGLLMDAARAMHADNLTARQTWGQKPQLGHPHPHCHKHLIVGAEPAHDPRAFVQQMRHLALQQLQQLAVFINALVRATSDLLQQHHERR